MNTRPSQTWDDMNPADRQREIAAMRAKGLSMRQMAEELGTSRSAIAGYLNRMRAAQGMPKATQNEANARRSEAVIRWHKQRKAKSSPSISSRPETPAGAAEPPPSAVPATLSVKSNRSNKTIRGGKPNTNRIAAVRSKSEASLDRHIARRMKARIETPKVDPGLPITITKAAAFDPLPGVEPVAFGGDGCKWPVDGYDGVGLLWCGAERGTGASYCCSHASLAFARADKGAVDG